MNITIRSSTLSNISDDVAVLSKEAPGRAVELTDVGLLVARREDIHALADQLAEEELLQEMSSYGKQTTGVDNTIWISPKGNTRHAARLKVAIDPPHAIRPGGLAVSVAIHDGSIVEGEMPLNLLKQVQQFIASNREVLIQYWNYEILTDDMAKRLKKI